MCLVLFTKNQIKKDMKCVLSYTVFLVSVTTLNICYLKLNCLKTILPKENRVDY